MGVTCLIVQVIQKYGTTFEHGHEIEFPVAGDDEFVLHGGSRCAIEDIARDKTNFDSLKDLERTRDKLYNGTSNLQVYRVKITLVNLSVTVPKFAYGIRRKE